MQWRDVPFMIFGIVFIVVTSASMIVVLRAVSP